MEDEFILYFSFEGSVRYWPWWPSTERPTTVPTTQPKPASTVPPSFVKRFMSQTFNDIETLNIFQRRMR